MFDALAHGIPFIASDLEFFKEFSRKELGMCVKRKPNNFTKALLQINNQYEKYSVNINSFKNNLNWNLHASKHIEIYKSLLSVIKHTLLKSHN